VERDGVAFSMQRWGLKSKWRSQRDFGLGHNSMAYLIHQFTNLRKLREKGRSHSGRDSHSPKDFASEEEREVGSRQSRQPKAHRAAYQTALRAHVLFPKAIRSSHLQPYTNTSLSCMQNATRTPFKAALFLWVVAPVFSSFTGGDSPHARRWRQHAKGGAISFT
jgi:hypothetical protein